MASRDQFCMGDNYGRFFYAQVDAELEALGICELTTAEDEEDEFMALQHHT
jgi:hypothetical protein